MPRNQRPSTLCTDTESSLLFIELDLPSLHTRPSATLLLDVLNALALKPPTFDGARHGEEELGQSRLKVGDGLPRYLTRIVSNQLGWIENESAREEIWELASARLSERSGRTGKQSCIQINLL